MFQNKNKKVMNTPSKPLFFYIKVGFKGVFVTWTCFRDVKNLYGLASFCNRAGWFVSNLFKTSKAGFSDDNIRLMCS